MAIWSSYNRASSALDRNLCEECSGNGQLPLTQEQIEQMVCGANICQVCMGTGLNKSSADVLNMVKEALGL
jgi:DnaJ-class molecular chaperone